MWVRVATFEGGDTEKLDRVMGEQMSSGEMTPPEGMSSVLILDDKNAKKRKFLAFFDSHDTLEAAEAGFDQQGDVIPEEIRGKRTSVHYYDVTIYDGDVDAIGLADRDNGRVSMITLWDSGDSMRASAQEADQLRERTAEMSDQSVANVALYE